MVLNGFNLHVNPQKPPKELKKHQYTQKPFQNIRLIWAVACVCWHLCLIAWPHMKCDDCSGLGRTRDVNTILNSEGSGLFELMQLLKVCPMEEERPWLGLVLKEVRGKERMDQEKILEASRPGSAWSSDAAYKLDVIVGLWESGNCHVDYWASAEAQGTAPACLSVCLSVGCWFSSPAQFTHK